MKVSSSTGVKKRATKRKKIKESENLDIEEIQMLSLNTGEGEPNCEGSKLDIAHDDSPFVVVRTKWENMNEIRLNVTLKLTLVTFIFLHSSSSHFASIGKIQFHTDNGVFYINQ